MNSSESYLFQRLDASAELQQPMHSMAVITGRGSLNHKPASTYDCPVDIRRCLGVPWGADAGISKQAIGADALTLASTSTVLCGVGCDTRRRRMRYEWISPGSAPRLRLL